MNALTNWNQLRWSQLNTMEDLQHTLLSLFYRSCVRWQKQHPTPPQWIPVVDVSEEAGGYVVRTELPQVKKEDLKVAIADCTLTITGDRKFDRNSRNQHAIEHTTDRFSHSFEIPADARPAKVSTTFKDGVLIVRLARNDATQAGDVECKRS
jgi:HSP20 family protein